MKPTDRTQYKQLVRYYYKAARLAWPNRERWRCAEQARRLAVSLLADEREDARLGR